MSNQNLMSLPHGGAGGAGELGNSQGEAGVNSNESSGDQIQNNKFAVDNLQPQQSSESKRPEKKNAKQKLMELTSGSGLNSATHANAGNITKLSGKVVRHIENLTKSRVYDNDDGVEDYYNFDNEVDNQIKIGTSEVSLL